MEQLLFLFFAESYKLLQRALQSFPRLSKLKGAHQRNDVHHVKLQNLDTSTKESKLGLHFLSPVHERVLLLCAAFLFGAVKGLAGKVRCHFLNRNQLSEVKVLAERWHCGRRGGEGRAGDGGEGGSGRTGEKMNRKVLLNLVLELSGNRELRGNKECIFDRFLYI